MTVRSNEERVRCSLSLNTSIDGFHGAVAGPAASSKTLNSVFVRSPLVTG
jgi:hypothetical protein